MEKLNILVLHRMGDPNNQLSAVKSLELMLPETYPNHNYIVHDSHFLFPEYLKDIDYHLIFLGPTFLCNRYDLDNFSKIMEMYSFIENSNACKVALPQDDYDCSAMLDQWMLSWNVDRIYTICPNNWKELYPKSFGKIEIKLGYTGYISEELIDKWRKVKPFKKRRIDISYRASKLPANFGSIGQLKWEIADRFLSNLPCNNNLHLDVSVDPKKIITGDKWYNFIENSKFCLTTPSGSSLLDPNNKIRMCINKFIDKNPDANFFDIMSHCFCNQDKKFLFTMLSPRNIEAGMAETVQIATPGSYSGLMEPLEHYIPLNENCTNIEEVLSMMKDRDLISKIRKQFKDVLLSETKLRRKNIVDEIFHLASILINKRKIIGSKQSQINKYCKKYNSDIILKSQSYWRKRYYLLKLKVILEKKGMNSFSKMLIKTYKKYFSNW